MKKILTTAILAGSTAATFAAISVTSTLGAYDINANPRTGTESLTVVAGDVVVLMASTNKKPSVATVAFSSTSGDLLISNDTATITTNNTNPNQWAAYTSITSSGTFDFTLTAQLDETPTINWVAYVLHSDTASIIELLDTAATDNFSLASGTLAVTNTYSWTGLRDATIIEASGSTNGTLPLSNGFTTDKEGGNANSTRILAHGTVANATGFDSDYTLAWVQNNASSGVIGYAFSETVPEPSSAALLGLGGLVLILRRRKG